MNDPSTSGSSSTSASSSTSSSAGAGMFGTALGGIGKAFGALEGGSSEKALYDYQAGVARLNAQIAAQNAEYAIQTGEHQAMQAGLAGAATMGKIKAAQGASGLDVNTGSTVDVQKSQTLLSGMNLATIRSNAAKTAYNYQVEGVQFGAQAQLDTLAGKNAQTTGDINAVSSIIGAASSVSSEWQRGAQLGIFGTGPTGSATPSQGGNELFG